MSDILHECDYDELVMETKLAWLLEIDGQKHWFPKYQCEIFEDKNKIMAPEWMLFDKGLS